MKYPVVLFDLDSTLLDTELNAEKALRKMSVSSIFPFNNDQMAYWHVLNNGLWQQFETGEITKEQLFDQRFKHYFHHFQLDVDTSDFHDEYVHLFANEHELMPNAKKLLDTLAENRRLFVVSNGTKFKQYTQIKGAGLSSYFEKVILSEDIGYQKPDKHFFIGMKERIPNADWSDMLIVGDSLTADIAGANSVNIDSIWYNPQHATNNTSFVPTFEVKDLLAVTDVLR